jgi:small-conductance mechanosensitive channel
MKLLTPLLASLLFIALGMYFTGYSNSTSYFNITLAYLHLKVNPELALFISSPFNVSTDGSALLSLYLPAVLIFILGVYLKNFNKAFQRKCSLRAVFLMSVFASYIKSMGSILYYNGYADYGISLGTSIITLSFIAAFVISLEVYVERKERFEHIYSHFMYALISGLILLLAFLTVVSFFATSSFVVHAMGLTAFLLLFIPFYERRNIANFAKKEEHIAADFTRKEEHKVAEFTRKEEHSMVEFAKKEERTLLAKKKSQ